MRLWKAAFWVLLEYPPSKVFPMISSFFWCHMYDVLVYKMLWDQKKILNISLWRIIRLSMRLATGLCSHISLHNISLDRVYCTRNLYTNDWSFLLIFSHKCHMWLQIALITLDKLYKILVTKDNMWNNTWHQVATYMNISYIQISLCGIVILQLLLQLNNVVALIIYMYIYNI